MPLARHMQGVAATRKHQRCLLSLKNKQKSIELEAKPVISHVVAQASHAVIASFRAVCFQVKVRPHYAGILHYHNLSC